MGWKVDLDPKTKLISEFVYSPTQQEIANVIDIERTLNQFDLQTLLLNQILNLPPPVIPSTFDLEQFVETFSNDNLLKQNKILSSLLDLPLKKYRKIKKPKLFRPWD